MITKPELTQAGETMTLRWPDGITVELERFHDAHGDITAEVTIHSDLPPFPGLLHHARLNLMGTQARASLAKQLESRVKDMDWPGLLEQLCYLAVDRYRSGEDPIDLRSVDPYTKPTWVLYPYLETGGASIIYAEGMVGKSILALWMGLQVVLGTHDAKGVPQPSRDVLYLDWETNQDTHAARLNALCAGMGLDPDARPPIHYRRMTASLPQAADAVAKWIQKLHIGMVIVDSLGMAGDGPPEESGTALGLAKAINGLNTPVLAIHHKRKKQNGEGQNTQRERLFGSVYYANFARLIWELDGEKDEAASSVDVSAVNIKRNNGPILHRHALHIEFTNDDDQLRCVTVRKQEMDKVPALAAKLSLRDRIMAELRSGGQTISELSEILTVDTSQIRARLNEMRSRGIVTKVGADQWGLISNDRPPI